MSLKRKYTHLFFDLDNTLWDFRTNSRLAMGLTFKHYKLSEQEISFDRFFNVYSGFNEQLWAAYRKKTIKKKELIRQRFQLTFDELDIRGIDPVRMNDHYLAEMPNQKVLMPGARDLLEHLKSKKYKLYIITNGFFEVQHLKVENSGLAPYFEKIFISEQVKCPKPGKAIFEHAIKSANAKKSKSVMIGDDWDVDIMGAMHFGIDAIYYANGKAQMRAKEGPRMRDKTHVLEVFDLFRVQDVL